MECRTTLKNLILVLAVTVSLDPFLDLFFLSFFFNKERQSMVGMHVRQLVGGKKAAPSTPL